MPAQAGEDKELPELHRARCSIVVLDVVESVRLMQAHEDDVIDRWRRFVGEIRSDVLPAYAGRLVKSLGDGMLLEFEHTPRALAMAFDAQRRIERYNVGLDEDESIRLRIGMHVDSVVADNLDLYGLGVNLASRIAAVARPRGVAASESVVDELLSGVDAMIEDAGPCFLKHLKEPVHVFHLAPPTPAPPGVVVTLPGKAAMANVDEAALAPCIAMTPFVSVPGEAESWTVGELIADLLLARLSTVPQIRVISRLSSEQFRLRGLNLKQVVAQTGASYLLSGRVHGRGSACLLFIELIDAGSEEVLWGKSVRIDQQDLFAPDESVTPELAQALVDRIMSHQLRGINVSPLPNLASQTLLFSSILLMHRRAQPDFTRAHDMLDHLAERHPRAAAPHAWLAKWHVLRYTKGWFTGSEQESARALAHTHRALDLNPDSAMALAMEAFVLCHMKRDLPAADRRLDDALQTDPNEAWGWLVRSVVESFRGNGEASWHCAQQARLLSPMDPLKHYYDALAAGAAVTAQRYVEAEQLACLALSKDPQHLPTLRGLAIAQVHQGKLAEARRTVGSLMALQPDFSLQRYVSEAPPGGQDMRRLWAHALREAGAPEHVRS